MLTLEFGFDSSTRELSIVTDYDKDIGLIGGTMGDDKALTLHFTFTDTNSLLEGASISCAFGVEVQLPNNKRRVYMPELQLTDGSVIVPDYIMSAAVKEVLPIQLHVRGGQSDGSPDYFSKNIVEMRIYPAIDSDSGITYSPAPIDVSGAFVNVAYTKDNQTITFTAADGSTKAIVLDVTGHAEAHFSVDDASELTGSKTNGAVNGDTASDGNGHWWFLYGEGDQPHATASNWKEIGHILKLDTAISDVSSLKTRMTAAESDIDALETSVASEVSARTAADTALSNSISAEVSARTSADTALGTRISAAESDISGLNSSLASEAQMRAAADTALATRVTAAEGQISEIEPRLTEAEEDISTLETSISSETSARIAADSSLGSRIDGLTTRVDTAESDISSLTSAVVTERTERQAQDASLSTRITSNQTAISSLTTSLSSETSARIAKDAELDYRTSVTESLLGDAIDALVAESNARIDADDTERAARTSADTALSDRISSNTSSISQVNSNLNTERQARADADEVLRTRIAAAESVSTGLNTRLTSAEGSISSLSTGLANETSARVYGDEVLTSNLNTEVGTRTNQYNGLRSDMTTAQTNILNLTTAVSNESNERIAADSGLDNRITAAENSINTLSTGLGNETNARVAADDVLTEKVRALNSTMWDVVDGIVAEANARIDADDTERAARIAADEGLGTRISAEISAREIAVANKQDRITVDTTTGLSFVNDRLSYTMPAASASQMGGVTVGENLYLNSDGKLCANVQFTFAGPYQSKEHLPVQGSATTIYLVVHDPSETSNIYDEYVWVKKNDGTDTYTYELLGTTQFTLTVEQTGEYVKINNYTIQTATSGRVGLMSTADYNKLYSNIEIEQGTAGIKIQDTYLQSADDTQPGLMSAEDFTLLHESLPRMSSTTEGIAKAGDGVYVTTTTYESAVEIPTANAMPLMATASTTYTSLAANVADILDQSGVSLVDSSHRVTLQRIATTGNIIDSVDWSTNRAAIISDAQSTMPTASSSAKGVIMVGDNLTINSAGVLSGPTVNDPIITFTQGGVTKGFISLNQTSNKTIEFDTGGGGGTQKQISVTAPLQYTQTVGATDIISLAQDTKEITTDSENKVYYWDYTFGYTPSGVAIFEEIPSQVAGGQSTYQEVYIDKTISNSRITIDFGDIAPGVKIFLLKVLV